VVVGKDVSLISRPYFTMNGLMQPIRHLGWQIARVATRLWRLLVFAFYLLLWSKVFKGHRFMAPLEAALLGTKSIQYLPPELDVAGGGGRLDSWPRGFAAVNAALFLNLRNPDLLSTTRYARPAPSFRAIYLWDSAFIAQIWKLWDPEVAWDILRSVVEVRKDDRLQHYVSDLAGSKFTQPPLLAWSFEELGRVVDDACFKSWANILYEPLRAYHYWLYAHRQLPNGLFAWAHPYESGVENAPRFASRDERRLHDTRNLAAPDFCSYMVLKCEALAHIAHRLGRAEEEKAHLDERDVLKAAVNEYLWDETEGLYFDRDIRNGEFVRSRIIASLLPLWAGIPDQRQAKRLCEHILDPAAFNTIIPLPSVALNDAAFEKDMWRGPVWLNVAFAVIAGLQRYGFHEEAADFAFRLCYGVYRTFEYTGRFHEFYDPQRYDVEQLHRKRGNIWKRLTLGPRPVSDFVGWSGLVNTLVIETLFGIRRTQLGPAMRPRFPQQAEGLHFSLSLPRDALLIELEVLAKGAVAGFSRSPKGYIRFEAAFGETIDLGSISAQPDDSA
jgi:hypothetical protein